MFPAFFAFWPWGWNPEVFYHRATSLALLKFSDRLWTLALTLRSPCRSFPSCWDNRRGPPSPKLGLANSWPVGVWLDTKQLFAGGRALSFHSGSGCAFSGLSCFSYHYPALLGKYFSNCSVGSQISSLQNPWSESSGMDGKMVPLHYECTWCF